MRKYASVVVVLCALCRERQCALARCGCGSFVRDVTKTPRGLAGIPRGRADLPVGTYRYSTSLCTVVPGDTPARQPRSSATIVVRAGELASRIPNFQINVRVFSHAPISCQTRLGLRPRSSVFMTEFYVIF